MTNIVHTLISALGRCRVCLAAGLLALAACHAAMAAPRLMDTLGGERPIRLQSLHIDADISGGLALTTVRMVFFNPNGRDLEGQLQFPLLDGQQITAFALDINGQMRPAVPVEKAKGRQIFEAIERRKTDPALLENTQGNNFSLRVYPIAAKSSRTVELKYVQALGREGSQSVYRLPLAYPDQLKDFKLTVNVQGTAVPPIASGALGPIQFARTDQGLMSKVDKTRYVAHGQLKLLMNAPAQATTYVQEHEGTTYFVTEIPVSPQRSPRELPKVVGLLWDSSSSGALRANDAILRVLDDYFKAVANVVVRVTHLRDRAAPPQNFKIVNGRWDELRQSLQNTVYDGASNLADWQAQTDVGEYLLVSDGLHNYGNARFPTLAAGQRLYALNASVTADTARLAAWAQASGGQLVQVQADRPSAAAQVLLTQGPHVQSLRATGANDVLVDTVDPRQGLLRLVGKLTQPKAEVSLTLLEHGKPKNITLAVSANAPTHALAAYLWGNYRLRQLEGDFELHRGEIRRIGTALGIPTRETSLIVLDSVEDYVRYELTPPADLLASYEQLMDRRRLDKTGQQQRHLEQVVRDFENKVAWWERSFPKDAPPWQKAKPLTATATPLSSDVARESDSPPMPIARPEPRPVVVAAPVPSAEPIFPPPPPRHPLDPESSQRKASRDEEPSSPVVGIVLKKWTSDAPYIARLGAASADTLYAQYLDEKPSYVDSSAFFLDVADLLIDKGLRELALRVLSNLAEMDLENRHVLRLLGYRLLQAGAPELAVAVFEKVQYLAQDEPQSFRDLGLAQAAAGHPQRAVDQLYEVAIRPWERRFGDIELIALAEMNAVIATQPTGKLDTSRIDPRLNKNLPLDLRVVLTWDADNSDMDLLVTDPRGEQSFYGNRLTYQGGGMSTDCTVGYGPEEFSLRNALPGKYKIEANFYGSRQQTVAGATTLQVKLSSGFGTAEAQEKMMTLRLKGAGHMVQVGEFEVKPR